MEFNQLITELRRLVNKPPEDVTAKMRLYYLAQAAEKNGLSDKQAQKEFLQQLKAIRRMTVDQEMFETLGNMITVIQKQGLRA